MHTAVTPTAQPATATQPATILVSLELSQTDWVLAVQPPDAPKMSRHTMKAGDTERLLSVLQTHRTRTERRRGGTVGFVSIQEAGLDGFWLHRWLEANGIESHVVDAASIAAPRRRQRAKTDGIDGETLVRTLAARRTTGLFDGGAADARGRGSPPPLTRARPTDARADRAEQSHRRAARRPGGARLPAMQKTRWTALEALRRPGGGELPAHLMAELRRLLQRLELLLQQLKAVEVERDAMVL